MYMHAHTHTYSLSLSLFHINTHSFSLNLSLFLINSETTFLSSLTFPLYTLSLSLFHLNTHSLHSLNTHTHTHTHSCSISLSVCLSFLHIFTSDPDETKSTQNKIKNDISILSSNNLFLDNNVCFSDVVSVSAAITTCFINSRQQRSPLSKKRHFKLNYNNLHWQICKNSPF